MKNIIKNRIGKVRNYAKEVTQLDYVKEQNKEILKTAKKVYLGSNDLIKSANVENFEEAKKRLNVDAVDIMEKRKEMAIQFYVYFALSILIFFLIIYFLFFQKSFMSALIAMSVLGICLANCFKYSFRSFQLKIEKLCPVSDWVANKDEWFPELIGEDKIFEKRRQVKDERKQQAALEKKLNEEVEEFENLAMKIKEETENDWKERQERLKREKEEAEIFFKKNK